MMESPSSIGFCSSSDFAATSVSSVLPVGMTTSRRRSSRGTWVAASWNPSPPTAASAVQVTVSRCGRMPAIRSFGTRYSTGLNVAAGSGLGRSTSRLRYSHPPMSKPCASALMPAPSSMAAVSTAARCVSRSRENSIWFLPFRQHDRRAATSSVLPDWSREASDEGTSPPYGAMIGRREPQPVYLDTTWTGFGPR